MNQPNAADVENSSGHRPSFAASAQSIGISFLAVVLISSAILLLSVPRTIYSHDESGWMASGYYYASLLIHHPFDWSRWNDPRYGPWGSLNPQLGKWLLGFPLAFYYQIRGEQPFTEVYDENRSFAENTLNGKVPPPKLLRYGRTVSAVFGLACIAMIFLIGLLSHDLRVGTLAAILVLANKTFRVASTRAMTDVYFNLFLLLFLLSLLMQYRRKGTKTSLWIYIGGIFAGCACSIKVTGLPICALILLMLIVYQSILSKSTKKLFVKPIVSFFIASLITVYALDPFFWPSFKGFSANAAFQELRSLPEGVRTINLSELAQRGRIPEEFNNRYPLISNLSHPLEFPLLYLRWNQFMNRLLAGTSGTPIKFSDLWRGNRYLNLHTTLFIEYSSLSSVAATVFNKSPSAIYLSGLFELSFLIIGITFCVMKSNAARLSGQATLCGVPLIYFVGNYLFLLFFLAINFDRYYLPAILPSKYFVASGMWVTFDWIRRSVRYSTRAAG